MEAAQNFSLVRRTPGAVGQTRPGVKRIVVGMVGETLELARKNTQALAERRFRIGDHELCEPDYRQILWWAEAMHLSGEEVILRLLRDSEAALSELGFAGWSGGSSSVIEEGRLRHLVWDSRVLPLAEFHWEPGLQITGAAFLGPPDWSPSLQLRLPSLLTLGCAAVGLRQLDLSRTPLLTKLWCRHNQLTELDLTSVPLLTELSCSSNPLTELDLTPVPLLTELYCDRNELTELDLTPVPLLTKLVCGSNPLTELDLAPVPLITVLHCEGNKLTELDLTPVPLLTNLVCCSNPLTILDLSPVPLVTFLFCRNNRITALELASVPLLNTLNCEGSSIRVLNIRPFRDLGLTYDKTKTVLLQRPDQHF